MMRAGGNKRKAWPPVPLPRATAPHLSTSSHRASSRLPAPPRYSSPPRHPPPRPPRRPPVPAPRGRHPRLCLHPETHTSSTQRTDRRTANRRHTPDAQTHARTRPGATLTGERHGRGVWGGEGQHQRPLLLVYRPPQLVEFVLADLDYLHLHFCLGLPGAFLVRRDHLNLNLGLRVGVGLGLGVSLRCNHRSLKGQRYQAVRQQHTHRSLPPPRLSSPATDSSRLVPSSSAAPSVLPHPPAPQLLPPLLRRLGNLSLPASNCLPPCPSATLPCSALARHFPNLSLLLSLAPLRVSRLPNPVPSISLSVSPPAPRLLHPSPLERQADTELLGGTLPLLSDRSQPPQGLPPKAPQTVDTAMATPTIFCADLPPP